MLLLLMLFLHIVDDYYLQGILSSLKQKSWWTRQETYCDKYKYDYVVALLMHAFSWTFMIMLPILYLISWKLTAEYYIVFALNFIIHAIVDDLKANKKKINLVTDQTIHILQIILTFTYFVVW